MQRNCGGPEIHWASAWAASLSLALLVGVLLGGGLVGGFWLRSLLRGPASPLACEAEEYVRDATEVVVEAAYPGEPKDERALAQRRLREARRSPQLR